MVYIQDADLSSLDAVLYIKPYPVERVHSQMLRLNGWGDTRGMVGHIARLVGHRPRELTTAPSATRPGYTLRALVEEYDSAWCGRIQVKPDEREEDAFVDVCNAVLVIATDPRGMPCALTYHEQGQVTLTFTDRGPYPVIRLLTLS